MKKYLVVAGTPLLAIVMAISMAQADATGGSSGSANGASGSGQGTGGSVYANIDGDFDESPDDNSLTSGDGTAGAPAEVAWVALGGQRAVVETPGR